MQRVVVTGVGVVTPLGRDKKSFWQNLQAGKSGIRSITRFNTEGYTTRIAGEIKASPLPESLLAAAGNPRGLFSQYAVQAAAEAWQDAGLNGVAVDREMVGVSLGTSRGGVELLEEFSCHLWQHRGKQANDPLWSTVILEAQPSAATAAVARLIEARGFTNTYMAACASGTIAIGQAYRVLQEGRAEIMVAGGTDAPLVPAVFAGTCAARAMSTRNADPTEACRPFDRDRDGYVMAEGAAMLVLEPLERARRRKARIYGDIAAFGLSNDAYHITAPEPYGHGLARAMQQTLDEARLHPAQVDYLNAHGTGTVLGDRSETKAIKRIFGRQAYFLPVSSAKSITGHLLGAAGALESVICLLVINEGYIPPTINYRHPDPECDLHYVPNHGIKAEVRIAMNNTMGFGGVNAVLLFKKPE